MYHSDEQVDKVFLLSMIDSLTESLGANDVEIDEAAIDSIIFSYRNNFPHKDGVENASIFKKVSYFLCHFVAMRPIVTPFSIGVIEEDMTKIDNHQNAIVAFSIARELIKNSTIKRVDGDFEIKKPLWVSKHSYLDIIQALSNVAASTHFQCVSVFFEQLAYKTNPECQYEYEDCEYAMNA